MRKLLKMLTSRMFISGLIMVLQFAVIVAAAIVLNESTPVFYLCSAILALLFTLYLVNADMNPSYKIAWIVVVLALPVFGVITYLLFGRNDRKNRRFRRYFKAAVRMKEYIASDETVTQCIADADAFLKRSTGYIENNAGYPVSVCNSVTYYGCGEKLFPALLEELEKAEKYIFLEFYIIDFGKFWSSVLSVLRKKAEAGVDVRVIYDDCGNFMTLPSHYYRVLEGYGIKTMVFNPFRPILDMRGNNRSHRKIAVIDGKVGFTGGINIADEYINEKERFGYWKDTAVMIRGKAVANFTAMFLQMWSIRNDKENYLGFFPEYEREEGECYAQPYSDAPQDRENVCENLYLSVIYNAKKYVYIYSPYLLIDHEMKVALTTAASCGVDVRIVVPHVPDKKITFWLTKAFYTELIAGGVKIYEYLPGFIHAKGICSDGEYAVVGTSNMDYRSFYLQFECGVFLAGRETVKDIERDYLETFGLSKEMTEENTKVRLPMRIVRGILRLFAPLM